jgi:arylsulfatase A-like enzyme
MAPGRLRGVVYALVPALAVVACSRNAPPDTQRLADSFDARRVSGSAPGPAAPPARTEWRFDGTPAMGLAADVAATRGWRGNAGVAGLAVRNQHLEGRTTQRVAILAVARPAGPGDADQVHAIEVRARISAGTQLAVATRPAGPLDLTKVTRETERGGPWTMTSPILPGERVETYTLRVPGSLSGLRVGHVLVWPSDAPGASFDVESVRLIFRREHLAGFPSGVSWQGLADVYQETIVTRAPETVRFETRLPDRPALDLALGTPEDGPLTFRMSVARAGGAATQLLEHTLTTPHRWERRRVDLSAFAGAPVSLSLSLSSEHPGAVGFWGAPTVRRLGTVAGRPQGVILVQGDTLRIDHLDAYGYSRPTAPTLRGLAERGVLFKNALSQTGWTKASVSSVMTSLYPTSHGVHQIPDRLPASAETLAESFRTAGYATVAFSSVAFSGRLTNLHQGFDELHEAESLPDRSGLYVSKTARPYVDRLADWLEQHRDTPFFVYLHLFDPHSPYEPRPPYNTMWADAAQREAHLEQEERLKKVIGDPFLAERGMATPEEMRKAGIDPEAHLEHHKAWYDGSIRGMDDELARLLERLRSLGLEQRTLMAFFADHGEELHDHGRMWHGQSVYGEMIRVPLILSGPGVVAQPPRDETVQLIDLMPTLLESSGIPIPQAAQGHSLRPLLSNGQSGKWTPRPAVAEKQPMGSPDFPSAAVSYAIVDSPWKLIHNVVRPPGKPEFELYEFLRDPRDQTDLAAQHPEVVARLAKALESWRSAARAARLAPDSSAAAGLTTEQLEKLRSLGYVK